MDETWYGITLTNEKISISHSKLMEWAKDNEQQFQVGWSHHFQWNGARIVRGPKMIATAIAQGWDDLAQYLEDASFKDEV